MKQYTVGTMVRVTATVKTAAGVLADPSTMVSKVKAPDGTVSTLTTVRVSEGLYRGDFLPVVQGLHLYEFIGTGDVQAAAVGQFLVAPDTF
jgi:hypothetical protein